MAKEQAIDQVIPQGSTLLVGLGNPGSKYEWTRHNIGFMLIDRLASRWRIDLTRQRFGAFLGQGLIGTRRVCCLKPQTYMNLSGQSVSRAASFFDVSPGAMVVAHDDIDLAFGALRLKLGGGAGGHKGLKSIDQLIGDQNYFRLRLGVGRPEHGDVSGYVLQRFGAMEQAEMGDLLDRACDALEMLLKEGLKATQNAHHNSGPPKK